MDDLAIALRDEVGLVINWRKLIPEDDEYDYPD